MRELMVIDSLVSDEEALSWQERSLCPDGPGGLLPEKGGSTREARRSASGARSDPSAWSMRWPTTSASASGAASERERRKLKKRAV